MFDSKIINVLSVYSDCHERKIPIDNSMNNFRPCDINVIWMRIWVFALCYYFDLQIIMVRFLFCTFCAGNRTARATANQNGQGDHIENIPPQSQLPTKTSSIRNTTRMSIVQPSQTQTNVIQTAATNPPGRRSYVVKEVERLKENREKRRAQQAEMKEQKNALMNMDPGNPNWELAAMIR